MFHYVLPEKLLSRITTRERISIRAEIKDKTREAIFGIRSSFCSRRCRADSRHKSYEIHIPTGYYGNIYTRSSRHRIVNYRDTMLITIVLTVKRVATPLEIDPHHVTRRYVN